MTTPLTVVTPTLNAAATLALCACSLKRAGVKVNHVVVDGGSTDETVAVARDVGARVILQARQEIGMYGALSQAFREVTTEWVTYLNADDLAWPEGYGRLIESSLPMDGVLYGDGVEFETDGNGVDATISRLRLVLGGRNAAAYLSRAVMPFQQPAAIIRTADYRRGAGFTGRQRIAGDVAMFRSLILAGVSFRYERGIFVSAFRRSNTSLGGRNDALSRMEVQQMRRERLDSGSPIPFLRDRSARLLRRAWCGPTARGRVLKELRSLLEIEECKGRSVPLG